MRQSASDERETAETVATNPAEPNPLVDTETEMGTLTSENVVRDVTDRERDTQRDYELPDGTYIHEQSHERSHSETTAVSRQTVTAPLDWLRRFFRR